MTEPFRYNDDALVDTKTINAYIDELEEVKAQLEQVIDIADDLADSLSEFLPESTSCDCEECIDVSKYHERIKKLDQFKEELKA